MAQLVVKRVCPQCGGTGTISYTNGYGTPVSIPCTWQGCVDGHLTLGYVEIDTVLDAITDSNDALEAKLDTAISMLDDLLNP